MADIRRSGAGQFQVRFRAEEDKIAIFDTNPARVIPALARVHAEAGGRVNG